MLLFRLHPVAHIEVLQHVASLFSKSWENLHLCIGEVLLQILYSYVSLGLLVNLVHVEVYNMVSNCLVNTLFPLVSHDEDGIKTREN